MYLDDACGFIIGVRTNIMEILLLISRTRKKQCFIH